MSNRCPEQYHWVRRWGRPDAKVGGVQRCIKDEGHDGPHVYEREPMAASIDAPTVAKVHASVPAYESKTQAEHDEAYREMVRRRARR